MSSTIAIEERLAVLETTVKASMEDHERIFLRLDKVADTLNSVQVKMAGYKTMTILFSGSCTVIGLLLGYILR